jgi:glyoxylate reductase
LRKKIFVTQLIPEAGIRHLVDGDKFEVVLNDGDTPLEKTELIKRASGCSGMLSLLSDRIDDFVLDSLPQCEVVANYAVGFDNIDVDSATKRGVWVTNTPDILTDATADIAFSLLLAVARRIVEGHKFCCDKRFEGWKAKLLLGTDLNGATLGIIGMGRIGQAMARRAVPFGMSIVYYNRNRLSPKIEQETGARLVALDELITTSDYISLHCPGGDSTKHIIGSRELSMMKSNTIIVNTARGTAIDEEALADCLSLHKIRGAGLDVYEKEPEIFAKLLELPNVVLAPHLGSATEGTRDRMAIMAADNILQTLNGERPSQAVNNVIKKS